MNNFDTVEFEIDNKKIEVVISKDNNSIWLDQSQMAILFGKTKQTIIYHLNNVLKTYDEPIEPIEIFERLNYESSKTVTRKIPHYNLEVIDRVGQRLKSNNAIKLKQLINQYPTKLVRNNEDIIIYDNGEVKIDVNVSIKEDTVWMNQSQIALLFRTTQQNISLHINNILNEGELDATTHKESLYVIPDGRKYSVDFYNLDMIISIGYRVNSKKGIQFRRWASNILKQYAINGYVINKDKVTLSIDYFTKLDNDIKTIKNDIDDIKKRTFIEPIKEKMFFKGQFYDAYETISNIIQSSEKQLIIIDPYFDSKALSFLKKKKKDVKCHIYLAKISQLNKEDLNAFQKQYGEIKISIRKDYHDRFIVVDRKVCYSIGSSLNQTGEKTSYMHDTNNKKILQAILEDIEDGL